MTWRTIGWLFAGTSAAILGMSNTHSLSVGCCCCRSLNLCARWAWPWSAITVRIASVAWARTVSLVLRLPFKPNRLRFLHLKSDLLSLRDAGGMIRSFCYRTYRTSRANRSYFFLLFFANHNPPLIRHHMTIRFNDHLVIRSDVFTLHRHSFA